MGDPWQRGMGALGAAQGMAGAGGAAYHPDPMERFARSQEAVMSAQYDACRQRGLDPHRWALTSNSCVDYRESASKKKNLPVREELQEEINEWLKEFKK